MEQVRDGEWNKYGGEWNKYGMGNGPRQGLDLIGPIGPEGTRPFAHGATRVAIGSGSLFLIGQKLSA